MALWAKVLAVALVVMGLSHTIARERICAPLREWLGGRETWLGYLVSCPYCVSHWIAFVVVPLTGTYAVDVIPRWGVVSHVLRWFLSSVLVAVVAAFLRVAFYFVDESQGLVKRRQKRVEEQVESARALRDGVLEASEDRDSRPPEGGQPAAIPRGPRREPAEVGRPHG
jgi:hypothetical protein